VLARFRIERGASELREVSSRQQLNYREAIVKIACRRGRNPTQLPLEPQITAEHRPAGKAELKDSKSLQSIAIGRS
jgi:hypothetical protein